MRAIAGLTLVVVLAGCAAGGPSAGSVSRDTFEGEWPLTVESGELMCFHEGGGRLEVVLEVDDALVYAVNGTARGTGEWQDVYDIMRTGTVPADLGDLIEHGLALCD